MRERERSPHMWIHCFTLQLDNTTNMAYDLMEHMDSTRSLSLDLTIMGSINTPITQKKRKRKKDGGIILKRDCVQGLNVTENIDIYGVSEFSQRP